LVNQMLTATVAALLVTYRRVRLTEFLPSGLRHSTAPPVAAEFGTLKRPATPWLWPIVKACLPAIKDRLRKLALGAAMIP
jgi:hypothetical protein